MSGKKLRGSTHTPNVNFIKPDLIKASKYEGHINKDHLSQDKFRVTNNKKETWVISSDKDIDTLKGFDKYKDCTIIQIP